ncbi:MAG: S8 family serine peptidase, partial [Psychrosphaera sp.]|nr:S8 family serine peptidase [Psychrosphaera sp.]
MAKKDIWKGDEVAFHDGRVLFKTAQKHTEQDMQQILQNYTLLCFEPLIADINLYLIEVDLQKNQSTVLLCNELNKNKDIIWAEPDFITTPAMVPAFPNDPDLSKEWHINTVGAPIAWGLPNGTGNTGVAIAILDSGIQLNADGQLSHPDLLSTRIVLDQNYADPGNNINDTCGHGTIVTGIVGADTN